MVAFLADFVSGIHRSLASPHAAPQHAAM